MDKYGFEIPFDSSFNCNSNEICLKNVEPLFNCKCNEICLKHNYKQWQYYFTPSKKPFFGLLNDGWTIKKFMDAVINRHFDAAYLYLSKNLCLLDNENVLDLFKNVKRYKYLLSDKKSPYGDKINSILVADKDNNHCEILNVYTINEPDIFSKWKIYKIEREY